MQYSKFEQICEETISQEALVDLLRALAKSPFRFVGPFRIARPRTKVSGYLTQRQEIQLGSAIEQVYEVLLEERGFHQLDIELTDGNGRALKADQVARSPAGHIILIEQKLRDDHDSTKRKGQIQNFREKLEALRRQHHQDRILGFFHFEEVAPQKNKSYYGAEIRQIEEEIENTEMHLTYDGELFQRLEIPEAWDELMGHLKRGKNTREGNGLRDFDEDPERSLAEITDALERGSKKGLTPKMLLKIFKNEALDEILRDIFQQHAVPRMLLRVCRERETQKRRGYDGLPSAIERAITRLEAPQPPPNEH